MIFSRSIDAVLRPQGHVFFGWYIVLSCAGIQWLASMLWMQSYGAYVVFLQDDFGWSKTALAAAFALTRIESGILGPLQGWLVDTYGPRLILRIGTVLFGIGFMLFSQIESIIAFYGAFILIALGSSLGGFATLMVPLVNWFNRHRAKAVALSQMGYAFGGFCVPLVVIALETLGWRTTALISGVLVILIGLPLVQIVRHRPETEGETRDGIAAQTPRDAHSALSSNIRSHPSTDFTARQAMRTPSFWFISFGHAFALLTVSAMMVHLIPHLTEELDFSLTHAAYVISLVTVFQFIGQFAGGYLGDRFNKRWICIGCMFAHALGLLIVTFANGWGMVIAFAVLHGLAWGTRGPMMVALRADYFGASSFGTIMGFSSLIVMLGMSGGPLFAGWMADVHGNYERGFSILALCSLFGALCFWAARPPKLPPAH